MEKCIFDKERDCTIAGTRMSMTATTDAHAKLCAACSINRLCDLIRDENIGVMIQKQL